MSNSEISRPSKCALCEASRMRAEAIENDLLLAENELRRERRRCQAFEQALRQHHTEDPKATVVSDLLREWVALTGRTTRTDIRLDGKRADRVRWALKSKDPEFVRRVFVAAGEFPFVWGQPPRRRRYGLKAQRYDDIPTLLRDEVTMERLVGLVDEPADDREVRVPQRALDAMHDRVRRLEWGVNVLRDIRDQQNDHVAVLVERLKGEAAA